MDCNRLLECLLGQASVSNLQKTENDQNTGLVTKQPIRVTEKDAASDFIDILRTAEKGGKDLQRRLKNVVMTQSSWTEGFAKLILSGVETLVRHRDTLGQVAREAMDKSTEVALEVFAFAKDHPIFVTIIAIGVLVIIAPWVIEALGFGELGPVADTFASWWQARYAGYVPKGSLFSFLQRMGMAWK